MSLDAYLVRWRAGLASKNRKSEWRTPPLTSREKTFLHTAQKTTEQPLIAPGTRSRRRRYFVVVVNLFALYDVVAGGESCAVYDFSVGVARQPSAVDPASATTPKRRCPLFFGATQKRHPHGNKSRSGGVRARLFLRCHGLVLPLDTSKTTCTCTRYLKWTW